MPDTMRCALHQGNDTIAVRDVPVPGQFPGSVLVRVRRSGICGSDLHMNRERTEPEVVPSGHEVVGEIVELPPGAPDLQWETGWPSKPSALVAHASAGDKSTGSLKVRLTP